MRKRFVDGFHYDAHPMGMFVSAMAALGTFYNDAKDIHDKECRDKQILRLIAKTPTLAAMCYRFSVGLPFVYPNNALSFPANFLNMMWKIGEYEVDPRLERAMDVLFILHADHEQNCGTTAMRVVGSSQADPYSSAAAAAVGALRPAARRRQRGGRAHARRDRLASRTCRRSSTRSRAARGPADGLRPPRVQELRPAGHDHQADRVRRVRGDRQEPAARHRAQARGGAPQRPVLHRPQAVPERRLLLRPDLPGDGLPGRHVHRAVRHSADGRLAGPLAGAARATRTRRSAAPASGTPAPASATTSRSATAERPPAPSGAGPRRRRCGVAAAGLVAGHLNRELLDGPDARLPLITSTRSAATTWWRPRSAVGSPSSSSAPVPTSSPSTAGRPGLDAGGGRRPLCPVPTRVAAAGRPPRGRPKATPTPSRSAHRRRRRRRHRRARRSRPRARPNATNVSATW